MLKKLISKITKLKSTSAASLHSSPINEHFGAELVNFSDITKITPWQVRILKEKINAHKLIVIRGHRIWTEQEQKDFTSKLGALEEPVLYTINPHKSSKLIQGKKTKETNVLWHSDNSFADRPSHFSIFQLLKCPSSGSSTHFASLVNLYKNIPEEKREIWKNYKVFYRDGVKHPLLWAHPYTGEDIIYFDIGFVRNIVNDCEVTVPLEVKTTNQIITYIQERLESEPSLYTHHWQEGDLIIVDNYGVAHKEEQHLDDEERILMRTTTKGIYF